MARAKLLPLVGAALFVLGNAAQGSGASQGTTVTYSVVLGKEQACLADIDGMRESAGLNKFERPTEASKQLPSADNTEKHWDDFCKDVLQVSLESPASLAELGTAVRTGWVFAASGVQAEKKGSKATLSSGDDGSISAMYAMMALGSSTVDCTSVLDQWKGAYKLFDGAPPSPEQSSGLYDNPEAVIFVTLYNPKTAASADCRVVTCTETTSTSDPQSKKERKGYAYLCMSTPNALGDKANPPFTKEQWKKIASSLKASAPAVVPSVLFVLFSVLGAVFL
ncbi:SAG family member [Eimeria praecox]|uniref:SAG family member n=1 Tax=Eimeria praecox TaxID=51316 RepID=U6H4A6_9EIME|nr:SAG family member [Eimeria praecox]